MQCRGRCAFYTCRQLTQRALTDLARSVRFGMPAEDRWHAIAWERACGPSSAEPLPQENDVGDIRNLPHDAIHALDWASKMLRAMPLRDSYLRTTT